MEKVKRKGCVVVKRKIEDLEKLAGYFDVIVNCTGLGSYCLVNDKSISPYQGHLVTVENVHQNMFWINSFDDDHTAIHPRGGVIIVGGTKYMDEWGTETSPEIQEGILKRAHKLMPSLKNGIVVESWTGLRPVRSKGVRLERELKIFGSRKVHSCSTFINSDCSLKCVCQNDQINCNAEFRCSPYAECRNEDGITDCYCNDGFEGDGETCTPSYKDCYDAYRDGKTTDGVYTILPTNWSGEPFDVFCNMTSNGGGWTVFQRRLYGWTDFYRNWEQYKNGFGSLDGDFWLGNEQLHHLTNQKVYELRIDMVTSTGKPIVQTYPGFSIANESMQYQLALNRGSQRTGLDFNSGRVFSTYDRDNDRCSAHNCAEQHQGGWWYGGARSWCHSCFGSHCSNFQVSGCSTACTDSNLNGMYIGGNGRTIIWYKNSSGRYCNMKYADMKIRPVL